MHQFMDMQLASTVLRDDLMLLLGLLYVQCAPKENLLIQLARYLVQIVQKVKKISFFTLKLM